MIEVSTTLIDPYTTNREVSARLSHEIEKKITDAIKRANKAEQDLERLRFHDRALAQKELRCRLKRKIHKGRVRWD